MEVLVVKSQLGEDFRRFTVPRQVRLLSLVGLLQKLYGYDGSKNDLLLKYKDDEGDLLSVTCDEELAEAFRLADAQGILRLELSLVPARTRTVIFDNKPLLVSGAAPSTYDERFDPPPKTRPEEVEIKIQIQPETKSVKSVVIERTPSGKSEIALPVAPRPNSVAFLSASTAVSVKDFSDQVMKNVDIQHVRARDASALASAEVLLATNESSADIRRVVGAQFDQSRLIAVPAEFVRVVTDMAAQTVELTNSYSRMTQELLDPLSKQTIDAANFATRDMAAKLTDDVNALVKMLMETTV